jgi:predicted aldo/keto reductase-like oxidoreductase
VADEFMMTYRRLGRTNLKVSVIGFGTCQLRMVPEQRAIDALTRSFSLGVNIVHTAPDYAGADDLVAEAVKASGREVFVCSQAYGDRETFGHIFETTCARFGKKKLEMFGVACVEDREGAGENVWGARGMVEFLRSKKSEGRLLGTFCTTHGVPSYIRKLVESNAFDAILMAYNPIGYHLLSYKPDPPVERESLAANRELFSLFASHDVGLMLMKTLAGGLLCDGKAFKPFCEFPSNLAAGDVLRSLLAKHPEVACVVPGTNSVEEAEENAFAGHGPLVKDPGLQAAVDAAVGAMQRTLCSRCGECDGTCSRHLPVSWLFRAAYIENSRSMPFETLDRLRYFQLHPPGPEAICSTCARGTCHCPQGIDIRAALTSLHEQMKSMPDAQPMSIPMDLPALPVAYSARLAYGEWASELCAGHNVEFRLAVDNTGSHGWHRSPDQPEVSLEAIWKPLPGWRRIFSGGIGETPGSVLLRGDVPPGQRGYFVIEMAAPQREGRYQLEFYLRFFSDGHLAKRIFLGRFDLRITEKKVGHPRRYRIDEDRP